MQNNIYTTGQVAKICSVTSATVAKWFDSGKLKGYRIPGSNERRIPANQLLKFMKQNNIPTDDVDFGTIRILLADTDIKWLKCFSEKLNQKVTYYTKWADNIFDLGYNACSLIPHVVIVNISAEKLDPYNLPKFIHSNSDLQACKVVAIASNLKTAQLNILNEKGFDDIINHTPDAYSLIHSIEKMTSIIH